MASRVANVLRGKHKASYTPHVDCGDYVIIINADKLRLTGNKMNDKYYFKYSGYPGGQRKSFVKDLIGKRSFVIIENAVKGMLPKNKLGKVMAKKLFIYAGPNHPHQAQQPKEFKF
jgi:large subunit ribosomal protein L13